MINLGKLFLSLCLYIWSISNIIAWLADPDRPPFNVLGTSSPWLYVMGSCVASLILDSIKTTEEETKGK